MFWLPSGPCFVLFLRGPCVLSVVCFVFCVQVPMAIPVLWAMIWFRFIGDGPEKRVLVQ